MQRAIDTAIVVFVTSTTFSLGLRVPRDKLLRAVRDFRLLVGGSLINALLVPAVGVAIAELFGLSDGLREGFVLIALSPGAPYAVKLVEIARGSLASTVGLLILLQLVALVSVPLLTGLFVQSPAPIDFGKVLSSILLLQLAPLFVGLAIQNTSRRAPALDIAAAAVSNLSFALVVILVVIADWPRIADLLAARALFATVALLAAALVIGYVIGGPGPAARRSYALLCSARKGGLALIVATATFGSESVAVLMIVAFALVELVVLTCVALYWRQRPLLGRAA
jgi:bile acid:Na+ symporter, BASS family